MKGFTLIEILLVIAIVLTVGFLSSAYPLQLISQTVVNNSADEMKSVLWKAQAYAMSGRAHSAWGVHYDSFAMTLFKGDSYNNRNQSFDEITNIDDSVSVSGFEDAIFMAPGGRPQAPVSNIIITRANSVASFSINAEGVME